VREEEESWECCVRKLIDRLPRKDRNKTEGRGADERAKVCLRTTVAAIVARRSRVAEKRNSKWEATQRRRERKREEADIHAYAVHTQRKRRRAREAEYARSATSSSVVFLLLRLHCRCESVSEVSSRTVLGCATLISRLNEQDPRRYPRTRPLPPFRRCSASLLSISLRRASPLRSQRWSHLRWRVFDLLNRKCATWCVRCVCFYSADESV